MDRRNFMKMFGALPLLTIFKGQNTLGLSSGTKDVMNLRPNTVLKIIEDVTPGQLVVIGSRPSMGKSIVALNIVNELTLNQNDGCVYFSIEMTKENLMRRWMSIASGVSHAAIKNGTLSTTDFGYLAQASHSFTKANVFINDDSKISVESLTEKVKTLKNSGKNIKFVFVDYLNLLNSEQTHLSRRDQVANTLRQLKILAVSENVIVVGLAQLNRGIEGRPDRRPRSADFRETNDLSSIDKLILLYREDYYNREISGQQSEIEKHHGLYHMQGVNSPSSIWSEHCCNARHKDPVQVWRSHGSHRKKYY